MLLKIGSNSDEVRQLQAKLGLNADGSFGKITEQKLKEWQQQHNQSPTGMLDESGWIAMFGQLPPKPAAMPNGGFNLQKIRGHIPDQVLSQIYDTAIRFEISNVLRLAHFLSQCGHESMKFAKVYEGLSYSAEGLRKTFPRIFTDDAMAAAYARNPEKTASKAYANKIGNGDEASGDGFRFRGRGYLQLTGKDNYRELSKFVGEDCISNPDLVATKYSLSSAAFYFKVNHIWPICDRGESDEVVKAVTARINTGLLGLQDRINHFKEYYSLLR